jgi:AcrR family transcriptional regulator
VIDQKLVNPGKVGSRNVYSWGTALSREIPRMCRKKGGGRLTKYAIFFMEMPQPSRRIVRTQRERQPRRASAGAARPAKAPQLERLIDAMIELAGQQGYQSLSIAQISSRAGVSSGSFYEHFADKEECLQAAYRTVAERTLARMQGPLRSGDDWSQAARGAFGELLASLQEDPEGARVMFVEALGGGERMHDELARVLGGIEQSGEALLDSVPAPAMTLDIPARALMGAVRTVVSRHLRTFSEDRLGELTEDLLVWMGSYSVPAADGRWSTSPASMLALGAPVAEQSRDVLPAEVERLPRGRHGLPASVVARSQRTRIVYATGWVTMEHGYANATVADIVSAAGVAKEAFYRHFRDKEEAFLEALQYGTHFMLDTLNESYFSAEKWPERIWRSLTTLLDMIAANPTLAHLRLVASYTAGGAAIRRAEDFTRFFTMFLEEGYSQRPESRAIPRLASQAISGAIFEIVQREVTAGRGAQLPERLPQLAYVSIAPFLGPRAAIERIGEMAAAVA